MAEIFNRTSFSCKLKLNLNASFASSMSLLIGVFNNTRYLPPYKDCNVRFNSTSGMFVFSFNSLYVNCLCCCCCSSSFVSSSSSLNAKMITACANETANSFVPLANLTFRTHVDVECCQANRLPVYCSK